MASGNGHNLRVSDNHEQAAATTYRRRVRYAGKNPRRFEDKYKELAPGRYPETIAKVLASGKTPAGTHVPILVADILAVLCLKPGDTAVDCTLGYGGHAREMLRKILPGGRMVALDIDPIEMARTSLRLRDEGFGEECLTICRSNFAGLAKVLAGCGIGGADSILADLGVSSMQLDTPSRGFSIKLDGPLDMRMNPGKGTSASEFLARIKPEKLEELLIENADEPHALRLAAALAGRKIDSTLGLSRRVREALPPMDDAEREKAVRRVFQALRIAVNEEFSALEMFLRQLPAVLNPGGRVAVLTFHSGEDRRVKKAFQAGLRSGIYADIAGNVIRPFADECRSNPRASSAKLRWAVRAARID